MSRQEQPESPGHRNTSISLPINVEEESSLFTLATNQLEKPSIDNNIAFEEAQANSIGEDHYKKEDNDRNVGSCDEQKPRADFQIKGNASSNSNSNSNWTANPKEASLGSEIIYSQCGQKQINPEFSIENVIQDQEFAKEEQKDTSTKKDLGSGSQGEDEEEVLENRKGISGQPMYNEEISQLGDESYVGSGYNQTSSVDDYKALEEKDNNQKKEYKNDFQGNGRNRESFLTKESQKSSYESNNNLSNNSSLTPNLKEINKDSSILNDQVNSSERREDYFEAQKPDKRDEEIPQFDHSIMHIGPLHTQLEGSRTDNHKPYKRTNNEDDCKNQDFYDAEGSRGMMTFLNKSDLSKSGLILKPEKRGKEQMPLSHKDDGWLDEEISKKLSHQKVSSKAEMPGNLKIESMKIDQGNFGKQEDKENRKHKQKVKISSEQLNGNQEREEQKQDLGKVESFFGKIDSKISSLSEKSSKSPLLSQSSLVQVWEEGLSMHERAAIINLTVKSIDKSNWVVSTKCHICIKKFRQLNSVHHCRACGQAVCGKCSSKKINEKRACDICFWEFKHARDEKRREDQLRSKTVTMETYKEQLLKEGDKLNQLFQKKFELGKEIEKDSEKHERAMACLQEERDKSDENWVKKRETNEKLKKTLVKDKSIVQEKEINLDELKNKINTLKVQIVLKRNNHDSKAEEFKRLLRKHQELPSLINNMPGRNKNESIVKIGDQSESVSVISTDVGSSIRSNSHSNYSSAPGIAQVPV